MGHPTLNGLSPSLSPPGAQGTLRKRKQKSKRQREWKKPKKSGLLKHNRINAYINSQKLRQYAQGLQESLPGGL